jgi:hypothetical protein
VLFVFSGKFTDKEKESLRKINALEITNHYITLIRSKFDNFRVEEECERDREALEKESDETNQLLNSCRRLLYINNDDDDDDDRKDSRKVVLDHLHNSCYNIFKPKE